jgi:YD repeat-containing protein
MVGQRREFSKPAIRGVASFCDSAQLFRLIPRPDPDVNSPNTHVSWKYWVYDPRGNVLFKSFPIHNASAAWNNFEYQPKPSEGTTSVFDELGRVLTQTRPSHNDTSVNTVSSLEYSNGGTTVLKTIHGPDPNIGATDVVLWAAPRSYVSIDGKEHVLAAMNQDNMVSEFRYDVAGNMTMALDPQGNQETRTYNSLGQLSIMENCYQKMVVASTSSSQPVMTYEYNTTGQLCKTTNAKGDSITFQRDSKGRPTHKIGSDGRLLKYEYDEGGKERLSSMTVYPKGSGGPIESKLTFEYDELARLVSRTLTLADGSDYETKFHYDWHGQTIGKTYPNGATKENQYIGALLSYSQVYRERAHGQREMWLDSRFEYIDATEKLSKILFGQGKFQHTHVRSAGVPA